MTLYLDTGAIVRLYLDGAGAGEVRARAAAATSMATIRTAYPEVLAAMADAERGGLVTARTRAIAASAFREDWPHYVVVAVTQTVAEAAAALCERTDLSAAEALHVAAASALAARLPSSVAFLAMDPRLGAVAGAEGLAPAGPAGAVDAPRSAGHAAWTQTLLANRHKAGQD